MLRILLLAALAGSIACSGPAAAAGCDGAATQAELDACAGAEYAATDKALNQAYSTIMKRLAGNDGQRDLLKAAQRAWIAFRDAECAFAVDPSQQGTIFPMLMTQCLNGVTQGRLEQLQKYLDCEEGDLSCPVPPQ